MTVLQIPEKLAEQLQQEAAAEGIAIDKLLEEALQERRERAQRARLDAEIATWQAQPPEIRMRYKGEYVAVQEGIVVDHDSNLATLHRRVRARFGKAAVLITPADGRPPLNIRHPRLARI